MRVLFIETCVMIQLRRALARSKLRAENVTVPVRKKVAANGRELPMPWP